MDFNKFKGISEEREIIEREKTSLEYMLEKCDEIIKKYTASDTEADEQINEQYIQIYSSLKKELQEFNAQDLASLVFAKANNEYDNNESQVLGLYTGILLHLLTERNNQKGQRTRFYINGSGNRFDNLFYHAKKIDELVVDSFVGDGICANIAGYSGKANKIILNNNEGYGTAWCAGSDKGSINTLVINNNKGDSTTQYAGSRAGIISTLIINNNEGILTAWSAGSYEGSINALIINNSKGNGIASFVGCDKGSINKLILCNITGECTEGAQAKQIISGEEAIAEYQKLSPDCKLGDVFKLLDSFKDKTSEEIFTAAEKIEEYLGK